MFNPGCRWLISIVLWSFGGVLLADQSDSWIYSSEPNLRIPIDLSESEVANVAKILIYVSQDEGKTWTKLSEHEPTTKFVTYQGEADGKVCFDVAVIDKAGKHQPALEQLKPNVKVVIDTTPPALSIKPIRSKSNKQGVRWEVRDSYSDTTTLALAVFESSTGKWRNVSIMGDQEGMIWFGDTEVAKIQMRIKDKAGNAASSQVEVTGDKFLRQHPEQLDAVFAQAPSNMSSESTAPSAVAAKNEPAIKPAAAVEPLPMSPPPMVASRSIGEDVPALPPAVKLDNPPAAVPVKQEVASSETASNVVSQKISLPETKAPVKPMPAANPPAAGDVQPAVSYSTNSMARKIEPVSATSERLIGAGSVSIAYSVESVDGYPTTKVELWGTLDQGRTWTKVATDSDTISPIEAKFTQGGVWGLMVCAYNEFTEDAAPKPGSAPDMTVRVDISPPSVEIRGVKLKNGSVVFEWSATDERMSDKPISLFYAMSPEGPWLPIASPIENSGEFAWPFLRKGVRGGVFFRMEARDAAGNAVIASTNRPFELEIPKPKAKLIDIASPSAVQPAK